MRAALGLYREKTRGVVVSPGLRIPSAASEGGQVEVGAAVGQGAVGADGLHGGGREADEGQPDRAGDRAAGGVGHRAVEGGVLGDAVVLRPVVAHADERRHVDLGDDRDDVDHEAPRQRQAARVGRADVDDDRARVGVPQRHAALELQGGAHGLEPGVVDHGEGQPVARVRVGRAQRPDRRAGRPLGDAAVVEGERRGHLVDVEDVDRERPDDRQPAGVGGGDGEGRPMVRPRSRGSRRS